MGAALVTGPRLASLPRMACGTLRRQAPSVPAQGCHSKSGPPRPVPLKKRGYDVTRNPHLNKGLQFTYNPSALMWRKYIWKSFGVAFDCLSEAEHKRRSMMAWRKSYKRRCRGQLLKARIHFVRKGLPGSLVKTQFLPKRQRKEENIPSHLRRGVFDRKIISF